ncbi:transcription factor RAX2-like [Zingiber officinale]|uniref:Uncharacterized protein n=1 Tax=Zingiber officinale TaxID=94328 RepID=A0A8J5C118_ZINOF|nr:transcription factor RAX2-like [Zingiber officinale]XP_042471384.1 transcription factor RAX2-like [Zingiber officinale]KAG6466573.1 hypothetical protein ZIOFF_075661 [Zingiber officinale]KAG6523016.1 hypothetical protein ZIOFF_020173 [Zingiber officinale]
MGRAPCCDKSKVKKGPWSPEEDNQLREHIEKHGTGGNWIALPQKAGLRRCGKSCRLRWLNYLRPNIKHGDFSDDEDRIICSLFANIGSRWSIIASQLPGRTDNDIKNYWNTKLKKKLLGLPPSHRNNKQLHYQIKQQQTDVLPAASYISSAVLTELDQGGMPVLPSHCFFSSAMDFNPAYVPQGPQNDSIGSSLISFDQQSCCSSSDASSYGLYESFRQLLGSATAAEKLMHGGFNFDFEEVKPHDAYNLDSCFRNLYN